MTRSNASGATASKAQPRPHRRSFGRALGRWLVRAAAVSLIAGPLFGAYLFVFRQEALVYRPFPGSGQTPADFGLDYEDVALSTGDGEVLHGWFLPVDSARGAIVYCHGNAGTISHRRKALTGLVRLGLDVLIFDYRGYGQSTGSPTEAGTYLDAMAAWRYVTETRDRPASRVVIWGRSLGGAVALGLAAQVDPGAVVLESTFTSLPELAVHLYPFLSAPLVDIQYASLARIRELRAPLLYAHSPQDDLIPPEHGARLFAAAGSSTKAFVRMAGTHNAGHLTLDRHTAEVDRFLRRVIPAIRPAER